MAAPAAMADVTVKTKVESGGFKGLGAFGGTVERSIQGTKAREASDIDFKGALMRAVTAARDGVDIVDPVTAAFKADVPAVDCSRVCARGQKGLGCRSTQQEMSCIHVFHHSLGGTIDRDRRGDRESVIS